MTSEREQHEASAFERQAREAFDDSVAHLDAATLSRLNQSRQRALEAARGRAHETRRGWWTWAPAGALAAAALVAVLLVRGPSAPDTVATNAAKPAPATTDAVLDPLTVLAAGDDLELAAEADLDFYAWVELETADDGVT